MLTGFYTIASGMLTQQRDLDVIGNNLVNQQTPGYRADRTLVSSFEMALALRREAAGDGDLGSGAPVAVVDRVVSLFHTGDLKETGRSFDLAINGDGFFNVATADGTTVLTRGGSFDVDESGTLVLPGVGTVLSRWGGPLRVGGPGFLVDETGEVFDQEGRDLGALLLTAPEEGSTLTKLEGGMFLPPQGVPVRVVNDALVVQGSLEYSNVDMGQELTHMVAAQRAFQNCSSAFQMIDAMDRKAASQIASV